MNPIAAIFGLIFGLLELVLGGGQQQPGPGGITRCPRCGQPSGRSPAVECDECVRRRLNNGQL